MAGFRIFAVAVVLAILTMTAAAQRIDSRRDLPEDASKEVVEGWLADALRRYGKYEIPRRSASLKNVKVADCTVSYTLVSETGDSSHATMGATIRTGKTTRDVTVDLADVQTAEIVEHIFPELRSIVLQRKSRDLKAVTALELAVQTEAAEKIAGGFNRAIGQCRSQ